VGGQLALVEHQVAYVGILGAIAIAIAIVIGIVLALMTPWLKRLMSGVH
jgi:hypothetical protein